MVYTKTLAFRKTTSSRHSRFPRLKLTAVAMAALLSSSNLAALGLGALEVQSNLDEPLNGVINLLVSEGDDLESVQATIAPEEDFETLGIDYPTYLKDISLTLENTADGAALRVDSADVVIKEPFIHFLVRIDWSGGSFLREYTALVDPPIYAAETPQALAEPRAVGTDQSYQPEPEPELEVEELFAEEPVEAEEPDQSEVLDQLDDGDSIDDYQEPIADEVEFDEPAEVDDAADAVEEDIFSDSEAVEETVEEEYVEEYVEEQEFPADTDVQEEFPVDEFASEEQIPTDAQYGPVANGESLSVIAAELQSQFPDLSIYQIMQVLFEENRGAFIDDNINGLLMGSVLNIGDLDSIRAVDIAQARQFFYDQISEWDPASLVSDSDQQDDGLRVAQDEYLYSDDLLGDTTDSTADTSEFDVDSFQVGASSESESLVSNTASDNRDAEVLALQQQITELESSLSSSALENQELSERISILEGQLADLNRLVSLDVEDAELANLEATLAQQNDALDSDETAPLVDDGGLIDSDYDDQSALLVDEPDLVDPALSDEIDSAADLASDYDELAGDDDLVTGTESLADPLLDPFADDGSALDTTTDAELAGDSADDAIVDDETSAAATGQAATAQTPAAEQVSLMEKIKTSVIDDGLWRILAGVGALLAGGIALVMFRRRRADEEFEISMLSIESQSLSIATDRDSASGADADEEERGDRETSFLTVYSDSDAVVQADEVDPIAEADVYIAYGRDEQAEEVLLDGITRKPDRVDIKSKLLALYHKNNNVEGFERIAEELYSQKSSLTNKIWAEVSLMGKDIAPSNPLFDVSASELLADELIDSEGGEEADDGAEADVPDTGEESELTQMVTVEAGDETQMVTVIADDDKAAESVDAAEAIEFALAEDDESINLINFDDGRSQISELDEVEIAALDVDDELTEGETVYADDEVSDDVSDLASDEISDTVTEEQATAADSTEIADSHTDEPDLEPLSDQQETSTDTIVAEDLDEGDDEDEFDASDITFATVDISTATEASVDTAMLDSTDDDTDDEAGGDEDDGALEFERIDVPESDLSDSDDGEEIEIATASMEVSDLEVDQNYDEARTQFELAKVFVDLGDEDGARKILGDIVDNKDSSDAVVADANELLKSIGG